ncbi:FRG domain-containing protein [Breoghania sp.]|uniref:FRG domain-containing protein n=1 Tax=Breoghania sp. TaxID=2065378 RepID=UPI002AA6903C|nr:FRG domain-containing protein [Breoghania sp.]
MSGDRLEWHIACYEKGLLERARHRGFGRLDGRNLSDFELLARLQHHGAATRLIDASRSGLVGLYFACSGNLDRAGMLFGIHSDHLGGGEGKLLDETYENEMKCIEKFNHPQTREPTIVSARIAAQHSQFIYSTIKAGLSHGSLAIDAPEALLAIRIPAQGKQRHLALLSANFDITHLSLFPDLDGFGSAYGPSHDLWANERG